MREAYNLEIEALRLQREAIVMYTGEGEQPLLAKQEDATDTGSDDKVTEENNLALNTVITETTPVREEPLLITQAEADEIENDEVYQQYATIQEAAARLMREAEVEYVKSGDLRKEAENQRSLAQQKRETATTLKKKKARKQALLEAEQLEQQAVSNEQKADSVDLIAQGIKNEATSKRLSGTDYLNSQEDTALFNRLLAYYQAKVDGVLKVQEAKEKTTFVSEEEKGTTTSAEVATETGNTFSELPLAEELTAEEFRKLDFRAIEAAVEKDLFVKSAVNNVSAYNEAKPIPIDEEARIPEGIIFKVQIGAFRNPIPQDLFKGFAPVSGERTGSGITRYTAGIFQQFTSADKAKQEIRNLGYSDAFVVAFRDGKRISIAEARGEAQGNGEIASVTNTQEVQAQNNNSATNGRNGSNPIINQEIIAEAPDVSNTEGLFYTVQVGVYSNTRIPDQLASIRPLNSEPTERGYIRYTSGIFDTREQAANWRAELLNRGLSDAFITAYLNGNRITLQEARDFVPQN